jgi:hypothetical protein
MSNPLVDAAIETLRLMGMPIPPSMPYLVDLLINEGEDVLTEIPRIVSVIETLGGNAWQVLEEIASGMASQGPVGYVQGLINNYFAPSIQIISDIHASKSTIINTHRTMLATVSAQLTTLAPQNSTGVANGQVTAFTGDAANAMRARYADISAQANQQLDVMEQSQQIDQDLLNDLKVVMIVGAITLIITLILMAIALVIEFIFAVPTVGGTLAIGAIVDAGILGTEAEIFLGAIIACFVVWAIRHALLDISTTLTHPITAPVAPTYHQYTYEPNPKHGPKQRGNIGAEPTNGQAALDNSVPIKGTSTRRVGVDPTTGEIVVFDETYPGKGVFHGHVRSWDELTQEMKNALIKAGLVDKKGRPIKKK